MHPAALRALLQMRAIALGDGLDLVPVSSFRDFERQAAIWNAKFRGERPMLDRVGCTLDCANLSAADRIEAILWWSALPGASRHHWGTDFDLVDRAALSGSWVDYRPKLEPDEFAAGGVFAFLNDWLDEHAAEFGFFRPYRSDRPRGVRPEPWHLSFAPVSVPALAAFSETALRAAIEAGGVEGSELILAALPGVYRDYVQGIDAPG